MKALQIFSLFFFFIGGIVNSQTISLVDPISKKVLTYEEIAILPNGQKVTVKDADGSFIIQLNQKFYKTVNYTSITPKNYGAKGDGVYSNSGDMNALKSGSDDTQPLSDFFKNRQKTSAFGSHMGGNSLYIPSSVYRSNGSYVIDDHFTKIFGDGPGATIIHAIADKNENAPVFLYGRKPVENAWDSLLTGGGISNLHINSENARIRNFGVVLDFTEYMNFENLSFRNIGKSAIKGNFWESYFSNIKVESSGQNQKAEENGVPETGIIDFAYSTKNPHRDASNNSYFNKITFSSCTGTLIKLSATSNTTVNINFNGLYAETYPGNTGLPEELPLVYSINSQNSSINSGFITVNSSGTQRNGLAFLLDGNSSLSVSNFSFNLNPVEGYLKRSVRRLSAFGRISFGSTITLNNVNFEDPTDSVGFGISSPKPLLYGTGKLLLNLVQFHILDINSGGTRRVTNLIDRTLKATGNVLVIPYDRNGKVQSLQKSLQFNEGKITLFADSAPTTVDAWEIGDKIQYSEPNGGVVGLVCTEPGTSGTLKKITVSGKKGDKSVKSIFSGSLLVGDWIKFAGSDEYNRISTIRNNELLLEQPLAKNLSNAVLSFKPPVWETFQIIIK
ncbi:hypothetical protein [Kaistella faecalis]|uniref:hypothetical protein n=1 Tax=Kaistella faecalis TaxID=2852098 RepID=UPI001C47DBEB|nr:hypothetical protein [Chryseobacterium faecale]UFK97123.1 hypothetical protein LL667_09110 [Chryseobacterium faecale]